VLRAPAAIAINPSRVMVLRTRNLVSLPNWRTLEGRRGRPSQVLIGYLDGTEFAAV
jgi:hypothetical protein